MNNTYEMPNVGCLLGMAYQMEVARLAQALAVSGEGITPAEYLILRALYAQDGVQQCELSRMLGKDKASISRSVQSLAGKGLVASTPVSYKCCMVSLTPEGEAMRPRLMEIAESMHRQLAAKLTPEQLASLREILETITKS